MVALPRGCMDCGVLTRSGSRCPTCTANRTYKRNAQRRGSGYAMAHNRVRFARGSASQYSCVGCGEQAQHWAYRHDDPNEQLKPVWGRPYKLPFSTDPWRYDPMCIGCHRAYDNAVARSGKGTFPKNARAKVEGKTRLSPAP